MIIKDLNQFSHQLKNTLDKNPSPQTAEKIALEIQNATYSDGRKLTTEEKRRVIDSIRFPEVFYKSSLFESDNSDFLKLVDTITKNVLGGK